MKALLEKLSDFLSETNLEQQIEVEYTMDIWRFHPMYLVEDRTHPPNQGRPMGGGSKGVITSPQNFEF